MVFEEVFKKYYWIIETKARKFSITTGEDEDELISFMQYQFWEEFKRFEKGESSFKSFIDIRLNQRLIDFTRNKPREFNRDVKTFGELVEKDEEGNEQELEFIDESINVEAEALEEIKTVEDKRQLIHDLIKDSDSLTTAIVKEFLKDTKISRTAIGEKLGIHHEVVRRRLDKLARKYYDIADEDIYAYLAV